MQLDGLRERGRANSPIAFPFSVRLWKETNLAGVHAMNKMLLQVLISFSVLMN